MVDLDIFDLEGKKIYDLLCKERELNRSKISSGFINHIV